MITAIILLALIFITIELFYQSKKLKNTHHVIRSLTKQINNLNSEMNNLKDDAVDMDNTIFNMMNVIQGMKDNEPRITEAIKEVLQRVIDLEDCIQMEINKLNKEKDNTIADMQKQMKYITNRLDDLEDLNHTYKGSSQVISDIDWDALCEAVRKDKKEKGKRQVGGNVIADMQKEIGILKSDINKLSKDFYAHENVNPIIDRHDVWKAIRKNKVTHLRTFVKTPNEKGVE